MTLTKKAQKSLCCLTITKGFILLMDFKERNLTTLLFQIYELSNREAINQVRK